MKRNSVNILTESIFNALFKLSLPIVVGNIAQTLYGLVDVYWLGKLGSLELAAVTLSNPIVQMLVNIGMGLSTATSILISQGIGRKDEIQVKSILNHVFILIVVGCGSILLLVGIFIKPILVLLGATGDIIQLSMHYLLIVFIGIEIHFVTNIYVALQNSMGNAKISFYANVIGLFINLIISPILIVQLNLSVVGAGAASLIARLIPGLLFIPRLFKHTNRFYIQFSNWRLSWKRVKDILKIAFPLSLGGATIQLGFMVMGREVIQYGNVAMAAYGIGNRISSLVTIPSNSIGNALTIIVGQNFGAGYFGRIKKAYRQAMFFSVAYLLVMGLILAWQPVTHWVSAIFIQDNATLQLAIDYVRILALYCFANGFYNTTMAVFNGVSKPVYSVIVDICRIWIFRIISLKLYSLIFGKSIRVVWYSVVFSNGLAATVIVLLYLMVLQQKFKDSNRVIK
ncbi:MATE family efflux transporter [Aerococcaceae bacterium zg-B36]|uniref:MATE family efflux transporter n=1 Tax=Aerococcaceae bacterium zg-252 TaxID=2796928 RepID=UPI001BD861B6|nr:MATE family efflux transporter [Aerococcaceae bacterium zg-B36]